MRPYGGWRFVADQISKSDGEGKTELESPCRRSAVKKDVSACFVDSAALAPSGHPKDMDVTTGHELLQRPSMPDQKTKQSS